MPPTQRHPARVDEHPAAVAEGAAGGVVGNGADAGLGEGGTALIDVHPAAIAAGGVAEDLPPAQRCSARVDEHPAAVVSGVVGDGTDAGLIEGGTALIHVHPTAVQTGSVAEDLPPAQCRTASVDVHPAAVAAGGVMGNGADAGLGEGGTALMDVHPTAAQTGGVAEDLPPTQRRPAI